MFVWGDEIDDPAKARALDAVNAARRARQGRRGRDRANVGQLARATTTGSWTSNCATGLAAARLLGRSAYAEAMETVAAATKFEWTARMTQRHARTLTRSNRPSGVGIRPARLPMEAGLRFGTMRLAIIQPLAHRAPDDEERRRRRFAHRGGGGGGSRFRRLSRRRIRDRSRRRSVRPGAGAARGGRSPRGPRRLRHARAGRRRPAGRLQPDLSCDARRGARARVPPHPSGGTVDLRGREDVGLRLRRGR